jgi:hypothetical protein
MDWYSPRYGYLRGPYNQHGEGPIRLARRHCRTCAHEITPGYFCSSVFTRLNPLREHLRYTHKLNVATGKRGGFNKEEKNTIRPSLPSLDPLYQTTANPDIAALQPSTKRKASVTSNNQPLPPSDDVSVELPALATSLGHLTPPFATHCTPSLLREGYNISEVDMVALQRANAQTLIGLLRPEDNCVHEVFTFFLEALQSGRVRLWDGDANITSWPGKDQPRLLRNRDWGLPKSLTRLCVNTVYREPNNEYIKVYRQIGLMEQPVPGTKMGYKLLKHLHQNNPKKVIWASNVPVSNVVFRPPLSIAGNQVVYSTNVVFYPTANVASKYTFIDTHIGKYYSSWNIEHIVLTLIDHGLNVLSVCDKRCAKLWVIHPPSTANMKAFDLASGQPNVFGRFEPRATEGLCFFTFPNDAIYLPPGTIHTVYTIAGGCLTGTTWASDTALLASAQLFEQEFRKGESIAGSFTNFVESLSCAVQNPENSVDIACALKIICSIDMRQVWTGKMLKLAKQRDLRSIMDRVMQGPQKQNIDNVVCHGCQEGVLKHIMGYDPRQVMRKKKKDVSTHAI